MPKIHYTLSILVKVLKFREQGKTFQWIADYFNVGVNTAQVWYKTALREQDKYKEWRKLND